MINKNKLLEKSIENNKLEIEIRHAGIYIVDELFNSLDFYINDNKQIIYKHLTASNYTKAIREISHKAKNNNSSIENSYINNNLDKAIYFMLLINDVQTINKKLINLRKALYYK